MKTLATAASPLSVWVIKNEFTFYLVVNEVHFSPHDKHQSPFIDYYANPSFLDYFVKFPNLSLLHIVHHV